MAAKSPRDTDIYTHADSSRINNTSEGLASLDKSPDSIHVYTVDPHDSPSLHWSGKPKADTFTVPIRAIHRHELVNPLRVLYAVRSQNAKASERQGWLFPEESDEERLRAKLQALDAYHHSENWTNRMIAGDSLVIMNSLLQKENMAGSVQTCYIDPPYGIKYGSNFQPFVNKKDVKDRSDDDLTREPEMIRAFRDTWELGIHSYLTYLRNRLFLVRELLCDEGSVFVQISDENVHHVRELCDEVFGADNFVSLITFEKTSGASSTLLATINDYLVWYAKDKKCLKYHQLYKMKELGKEGTTQYTHSEGERIFALDNCTSAGKASQEQPFSFEGKIYYPSKNRHWRITYPEGMEELAKRGRLQAVGNTLMYKQYLDDFPVTPITNVWNDTKLTGFTEEKRYVVQTSTKVIQRCILMTSDPGDLVLDITCGSGTTAYTAEQWGRRWITCDTSRVAIAIARQRLLTANFDWYKLADPKAGLSSGFVYKTVPHITLKSIANNEPPAQEILYDQPEKDQAKTRLAGPFTVESLPAPAVFSPEEAAELDPNEAQRQSDWREQLRATGIRGKNGERIRFSRVEAIDGTRWLNARAWTDEESPRLAVICFADTSSLMDSKRVSLALDEAEKQRPSPEMVVFAAFQFNPESQELINSTNWPGVKLLQVKMNDDLVTSDLKRNVKTDESFWLVGRPDVELLRTGEKNYRVRVLGFDYYNVRTDKIDSGDADKIAMWMLDPDYNGMTMNPTQVFFPLGGWEKLAKTLRAEVDPDLLEAYSGTESLEFEAEDGRKIAVKIIDDRGIESMRVLTAGDGRNV